MIATAAASLDLSPVEDLVQPGAVYAIKIYDARPELFKQEPQVVSIAPAGLGWNVRSRSVFGATDHWRPTLTLAKIKAGRIVGHELTWDTSFNAVQRLI